MGNKELSKKLEIEEEEAATFKTNFFKTYVSLSQYIESCKESLQEKHYVETLYRRKRYIYSNFQNNSSNDSRSKRQAINTTIQGSAADIVKMSMIITDREATLRNLKFNLVFQLFDELIYEVEQKNVDYFAKLLSKCMEGCAKKLSVKMPVKVKKGLRWHQMEQVTFD